MTVTPFARWRLHAGAQTAVWLRRSLGIAALPLLSASAWAANPCDHPSPVPLSGLSTAGPLAQAPGMGGTGAPTPTLMARSLAPGGMGGTGAARAPGGLGGTGIVGVISGFASLCVNGLELHYDAHTPLTRDGRRVAEAELAVGQWVAVQAQAAAGGWQAQRVSVLIAASATLEAVAADHLQLLGQTVQLAPGLHATQWNVGQRVQISGVRDAAGRLHASHVARAPDDALDAWTGVLERVSDGEWQVDGLRVRPSAKPDANVQPGQEVQVLGRWDGARLNAQSVHSEPTRQALGAVQGLIVSGYVRSGPAGPSLMGLALHSDTALTQAQTTGERVQVQAQRDALGRMQVQQVRSAAPGGPSAAPEAAEPATPAQPIAPAPAAPHPMQIAPEHSPATCCSPDPAAPPAQAPAAGGSPMGHSGPRGASPGRATGGSTGSRGNLGGHAAGAGAAGHAHSGTHH